MKKKFLLTFLAISSLLVGCGEQTSISNPSSSNDIVEGDYWDVSSPDKKLNARVILQDDGSLKYSIKKNRKRYILSKIFTVLLTTNKLQEGWYSTKTKKREITTK